MRYKNVTENTVWIGNLHISVEAGAEFETDADINSAQFERVGSRVVVTDTVTVRNSTGKDVS